MIPNYGDNWMIALTAVNNQNLMDIHPVTLNLAAVISSKTTTVGNVVEIHDALGPWDAAWTIAFAVPLYDGKRNVFQNLRDVYDL